MEDKPENLLEGNVNIAKLVKYTGVIYYTNQGMEPWHEIGWRAKDCQESIPYPPEMWFTNEMLCMLATCPPERVAEGKCCMYPGWSYQHSEQLSPEFDVVRYESDEQFWLWVLTGDKDLETGREYGKWKD